MLRNPIFCNFPGGGGGGSGPPAPPSGSAHDNLNICNFLLTGLTMALTHEVMAYWNLNLEVHMQARELCLIILVRECLIMLLKVRTFFLAFG